MSSLERLVIPGLIIQNNTWNGVQFTMTDDTTGNPIDITLAQFTLQMKLQSTNQNSILFKTNPGAGEYGITITDAANGVFKIDKVQILGADIGTHEGILVATFSGGDVYSQCIVELTVRKQ